MPTLHDLQHAMLDRIIRQEKADGLPVRGDPPFSPDRRLQVYRNNTQQIMRDLLRGTFPVTAILLGGKFFNFAAHEFVKAFPPAGGDMNAYGAGFPEYLANLPNLGEYPYVPDVARLEWLAQDAYMSPRDAALAGADLAAASDPLNLKLRLQPHVRLLRSAWPVDDLWSRVTEEGEELKDFDMRAEESFCAIFRDGERISVWSVSEGAYCFLENLQLDPSLAFAAEAALRAEPQLALDRLLGALLQQELLAKSGS